MKLKYCCRHSFRMMSEIDIDAQDVCFFISDMAMPTFVYTTGMSIKPA